MNVNLRNLTNSFLDVRLVSLASWQQAAEISPRDRNGPYMVIQEGYDPEDLTVTAHEFVIGRSGKWILLAHFFRLPVVERRAEFVFGTAAEVIQMMNGLPSQATILGGAGAGQTTSAETAPDDMMNVFQAAKSKSAG